MKIKILAFRSNSLLGKMIRWQTDSDYSHIAMIIGGVLYESQAPCGVRELKDWNGYVRENDVDWFDVEVTHGELLRVLTFARQQIGKDYDYGGIGRFITRHSHESRKSSGKWFCSEYVFQSLAEAGIHLLRRIPSWKVSPAKLVTSPVLIETNPL